MIKRKITNKLKNVYCTWAESGSDNRIETTKKLVVTTFYDVEGDYAITDMTKPCFEAIEKIVSLEESLGVHSTYNVVARFAEEAPELFRDIENLGNEISSHSYDHCVLTDMGRSRCRENILATRRTFDRLKLNVIGHRSPQSMWNLTVLSALYENGFVWNAENGADSIPYKLPISPLTRRSLWRLPVSIDDWGYEGNHYSPELMLSLWKKRVENKLSEGGYLAIGFHPWVENPTDRFETFRCFMTWLATHDDIDIMPFGHVIENLR